MIKTIDKNFYKIFITIIKYVPITLLCMFVIGCLLNLVNIPTFIISCIGGTSLISLGLLYMLSYIFRFCNLHRLPLHYVTISNMLTIANTIFTLVNIMFLIRFLFIVGGIILIYYIIRTYLDRNKPKPDCLQMFCERYCGC